MGKTIDYTKLSESELNTKQQEWESKNNELEQSAKYLQDNYEKAKIESSNAATELNNVNNKIDDLQKQIDEETKNNADPTVLQELKTQMDNEEAKQKVLEDNYNTLKDVEDDAYNDYQKINKELEENKNNEPLKLKTEQETVKKNEMQAAAQKKQQEDTEKLNAAKAKIQEMLNKISDPAENIHKTVCLKAAVLPGTSYAINFCIYLQENTTINSDGTCDWYTIDENNNTKINASVLKTIKKEWLLERASQKASDTMDESEEALNDSNNNIENANTDTEKLNSLSDKIDTLEQNISSLKKEQTNLSNTRNKLESSVTDSSKTNAQLTEINTQEAELNAKIASYENELKTTQDERDALKQQIDAENKKNKELEEAAKKQEKELNNSISWWKSNLKKWKQKQLDDAHKKYGASKMKVIDDIVTEEELNEIAKYISLNPEKIDNLSYSDLESSDNTDLKNIIFKRVWNMQDDILSIKNSLSPELLEKADEIKPDAALACFSGAVSNTFELAAKGLQLAASPEILEQTALIVENATAAALARLNERVTKEITNSIIQITDITPITQIPVNAAQEMLNHIWTPADIIAKIQNDMNENFLSEELENELNKNIEGVKSAMNKLAGDIQYAAYEKLSAYTEVTNEIINTLNQSPMWYVDNINLVERRFEKEIIKNIQNATVTALDSKFQFVDFMTTQFSYNLVQPVNKALEDAQTTALRKVVELEQKAVAKAKSLAAAAAMKILGLLGA